MIKFKNLVVAGLFATTLNASTLFNNNFDDDFSRMNQIINSMMSNSFKDFKHNGITKVNMYEKNNKYYIEYQVPGTNKEDLKLSIENHLLKLETIRQVKKEEKNKNYVKKEFSYGKEQRVVMLPEDAIVEKLKTKYNNGLLIVTIPKKPQLKLKTKFIKID